MGYGRCWRTTFHGIFSVIRMDRHVLLRAGKGGLITGGEISAAAKELNSSEAVDCRRSLFY